METEHLPQKVIGNAMSSYFMFFACIFFFWSREPSINHPFVRSHVKSALLLQTLMAIVLLISAFGLFRGVIVFGYPLSNIITMVGCLIIFSAILYGVYTANKGETLTVHELVHAGNSKKSLFTPIDATNISEETSSLMIAAQIPFLGYIIAPRHKDIGNMRDISLLNIYTTVFVVLLYIAGHSSLASILILIYTIWCVFQSLHMLVADEYNVVDMSRFPTPEQGYLLIKSSLTYLKNMVLKRPFIPFSNIYKDKLTKRREQEVADNKLLSTRSNPSVPSWIFSIPGINIIGLSFLHSRDLLMIRTGLVITLITGLIIWRDSIYSQYLILVLFPICFGIGYDERVGYRMPFIYDIYALFGGFFKLFSFVKKLHHTKKTASFGSKQASAETNGLENLGEIPPKEDIKQKTQ